jgi:type 1 glutamine amidotransferase
MLGGSFDFHPRPQEVTCRLVDPNHPLVLPFKGKPLVHRDEPYLFNKAYLDMNFRPLLEMDTSNMEGRGIKDIKRYVSWIKRYGKGRVFYCSPSHFEESYENPALLSFMLNGIQYAAGDLACDDSPLNHE